MNRKQLIFGNILTGIKYQDRPAAYAVITNEIGSIAAVKGNQHYFLPGGGSLSNETPEATIHRELREELARDVKLIRKIGEAIQYFSAGEEYYRITGCGQFSIERNLLASQAEKRNTSCFG